MATNNFHTRINDHKLSFGMVRYATGIKDTDDHFWRLIVSRYCGSEKLEAFDVSLSDLIAIKSFCDKAIKCLQTDGDRNLETKESDNERE